MLNWKMKTVTTKIVRAKVLTYKYPRDLKREFVKTKAQPMSTNFQFMENNSAIYIWKRKLKFRGLLILIPSNWPLK